MARFSFLNEGAIRRGENLRTIRESQRKSRKAVSDATVFSTYIDEATIGRWERGEIDLFKTSFEKILSLSEALGVSYQTIIGDPPEGGPFFMAPVLCT